MSTCRLCSVPFFGGHAWGDVTCGDCIAAMVQSSLTGSLFGAMRPAQRAPRDVDVTIQVEELPAPRVANG